jgi:hypothetical protein
VRQKIGREGLLQQRRAVIFFILEDTTHRSLVPLPFATWGWYPTRSQKPGDAAGRLTVQEAFIDPADDAKG